MIPIAILGYAHDKESIQAFIDALVQINCYQLRRGHAPRFDWSRLRYRRETHETLPGVERLNTAEEVAALGIDDCDGLAPYLAASLIVHDGIAATAVVVEAPGIGYHVVVRLPNGRVVDPSARLGMLEGGIGDTEEDEAAERKRKLRTVLSRLRDVSKKGASLYGAPYRALGTEAMRLTQHANLLREDGER